MKEFLKFKCPLEKKWSFSLNHVSNGTILRDHLEISWKRTSYIAVLIRWCFKMCCASWFKDDRSQSPFDLSKYQHKLCKVMQLLTLLTSLKWAIWRSLQILFLEIFFSTFLHMWAGFFKGDRLEHGEFSKNEVSP